MRESYFKGTKAHEASSDFIVNHWLRFFGGIAAPFQVQIIIRILLRPLRKNTGQQEQHTSSQFLAIPYTERLIMHSKWVHIASGQTQLG
jgi:hypothetical protein